MGTVLLWFGSNLFYFFMQEVGVLLRHRDSSVVAQFADKSKEIE